MQKLNSGFSQLADAQFDNVAMAIHAALNGNANFATTSPTQAVLLTLIAAYQTALALPPGAPRDAQVTATRAALESGLQTIAANLELVPNVTDVMLATTGFALTKPNTHTAPPPTQPTDLRLVPTGQTGEVKFVFKASVNARGYETEMSTDPNSGTWTDRQSFSSTRDVIVPNQPRKTDVWGRVRALGTNNQFSAWSDPATMLVS
jgi:hypothetical protein